MKRFTKLPPKKDRDSILVQVEWQAKNTQALGERADALLKSGECPPKLIGQCKVWRDRWLIEQHWSTRA